MEFEKYHKIKMLGDDDNKEIFTNPKDEIIVEEKVDGGNFRFMFGDKGLIMGSRTRELDEDNPNCNAFKRCMELIKDKCNRTKLVINGNFIYYGECMIQHTFCYDWEKMPPYLGFDIKDVSTGKYLSYAKKIKLFKELDLPIVPLIKKCKVKDLGKLTEKDIPLSKYPHPSDKNYQTAEGIVLKNYNTQQFAKIVQEVFREKARETFGTNKKWAENDNDRLVAVYCTNARIDKIIFKLIDDGKKLGMELMEDLPKRLLNDIYEEHWKEICFSNWSINFRDIRKKMSKRCVAVLKQMMANNAQLRQSQKNKR